MNMKKDSTAVLMDFSNLTIIMISLIAMWISQLPQNAKP